MGIISDKQDLTYLKWSHIRSSSGTAGTFLKSESVINGKKTYYKLSNFDPVNGVVGHECINEIIVDRLLTVLGVEHLSYDLINAEIEIEGRHYSTYLCASEDFKKKGESKIALNDYHRVNAKDGESHYEFCVRCGWRDYIERMLSTDYLILNRDRHGANIEVLRSSRAHTIRLAPLFDHGLSLLFSCTTDAAAAAFDVMADKPCRNFIGEFSCFNNLRLIKNRKAVFPNRLHETDRNYLFEGLKGIMSETYTEKIWSMIYQRYQIYENL